MHPAWAVLQNLAARAARQKDIGMVHRRTVCVWLLLLPLVTIGVGSYAIPPQPDGASAQEPFPAADSAAAGSVSGRALGGIYRVYYDTHDRLADLAAHLDIWEVQLTEGYALIALSGKDVARLRDQGYRLEADIQQTQQWLLGPPDFPCYRNVDELYAALQQAQADYPHLASLIDYGDSWQKVHGLGGYDLWVLRITSSQVAGPKPRLFVMANIHARELTTPETALYFVQTLLEGYGVDPDVTWIVDYHEIYVVVTANPDGRQYVETGCYQRKNLDTDHGGDLCESCSANDHQGVDLNRNNPYRWGGAGTGVCEVTYQGVSAASEPETYYLNELVRSLLPDQRPDEEGAPAPEETTGLLISLHSYGPLVLWPWGWTYDGAPNEAELQTLGRKFAYLNGYDPQQASDLYPTTGDTTDWAYGELGIPAYTFELGNFFFERCAELPQILRDNLTALLYAAKVARSPYQTPAGPDAVGVSVLPAVAPPGTPVLVTATMDDARYKGPEPAQPIAAAVYFVDVPPWITTTAPISGTLAPVDGHFDGVREAVQATLDTAGLESGQHIVFVRGRDTDGNWGAIGAAFFSVGNPVYLPMLVRDGAAPGE